MLPPICVHISSQRGDLSPRSIALLGTSLQSLLPVDTLTQITDVTPTYVFHSPFSNRLLSAPITLGSSRTNTSIVTSPADKDGAIVIWWLDPCLADAECHNSESFLYHLLHDPTTGYLTHVGSIPSLLFSPSLLMEWVSLALTTPQFSTFSRSPP